MSRLQRKQPIAVTCPSHQVNNITEGGGGRENTDEGEARECRTDPERGGRVEDRKPGTHREADANGGGEGARDELALVELNQQRGLAHAAVSHQDGLQRESHREARLCLQTLLLPEARTQCGLIV